MSYLHAALLALAAVTQPTITGKVVSVTDGDTLRIYVDGDRATTKIRLDAIDAPEKGQPFGTVSRQYLAKLAKGKQCTVRNKGSDKYGRVLGIVTKSTANPRHWRSWKTRLDGPNVACGPIRSRCLPGNGVVCPRMLARVPSLGELLRPSPSVFRPASRPAPG